MQQIYTTTSFSITKTYNIELKVHRNLLNKSIGLEFCFWHLSLRALLQLSLQQQHCDVIANEETSSDPGFSKLDYSTLVQYFRVALYRIGKGVTPPPSYNTLVY